MGYYDKVVYGIANDGAPDKAAAVAMPTYIPRAVFGVSLEESLDVAQIASLPAIVFRCIQYLEAKKAEHEEGIYRLSGSSAVIKSMKDRFNAGAYCNLGRACRDMTLTVRVKRVMWTY